MHLNGYSDIQLVGEGGLGRVYRAVKVSTGGTVAIKELRDISAGSPAWHRARRELDAMLRLKGHAHVINVEEVIDGSDGPCLIMEYAPGGSLFDRVQQGPLSAPELVLVGQHVCDALTASHAAGVLHRDIKPHNLLIDAFGQVKVCDFGIASLTRDGESRTKTGALTMAYASPEELDGSDDIGPAADVYSFAATMLHLASGRRPSFRDRVDATTAEFAVRDDALSPAIKLLRRALANDPQDRPLLAELSASFDDAAYSSVRLRIKALDSAHPPRAAPNLTPRAKRPHQPPKPPSPATKRRETSKPSSIEEAATVIRPRVNQLQSNRPDDEQQEQQLDNVEGGAREIARIDPADSATRRKPTVEVPVTDDRWLPDPLGREFERLWNGTQWTAHVRSQSGHYHRDPDLGLSGLFVPTEFVVAESKRRLTIAEPRPTSAAARRQPIVEVPVTDDRWLPDPLGREFERLWNGTQWTAHVRSQSGHYHRDPDPGLSGLDVPTEPLEA